MTRGLNLISAQVALVLLGIYWAAFFVSRRWVASAFPESLRWVSLTALAVLGFSILLGIASVLLSHLSIAVKFGAITAIVVLGIGCYMLPYSIFPHVGSSVIADTSALVVGLLLVFAGGVWFMLSRT